MVRHVTWVMVALVACGDEPEDDGGSAAPTCAASDIVVEVGNGDQGFVPLEDGDVLSIVHGPQGGWHVDTAGLVANTAPEIRIEPTITVVSSGLELTGDQAPNYVALADYEACEGIFFGTRAYLKTTRDEGPSGLDFVCSLAGETVELTIAVGELGIEDEPVREGFGVVTAVIALDPVDAAACP